MITLSKDIKVLDKNHNCLYQVAYSEEDAQALRLDGWQVWEKPINGIWKAIKKV